MKIKKVYKLEENYQIVVEYNNEDFIVYTNYIDFCFTAYLIATKQKEKNKVSKEDRKKIKEGIMKEKLSVMSGLYGFDLSLYEEWLEKDLRYRGKGGKKGA